jgi:hypothetical protein
LLFGDLSVQIANKLGNLKKNLHIVASVSRDEIQKLSRHFTLRPAYLQAVDSPAAFLIKSWRFRILFLKQRLMEFCRQNKQCIQETVSAFLFRDHAFSHLV